MRVYKKYDAAEYNSEWYKDDEIDITIDGTSVTEDMDSSSGNLIRNKSYSRNSDTYAWVNYADGKKTLITDKMHINHQITFEGGSVSDDDKTFTTAEQLLINGSLITIDSDGSSFPDLHGLIQIEDELIYYDAKTVSGSNYILSSCIRGYAHTVESSHANGSTVTNMTDSAIDRKYKIELLRIRGGTFYIWWRIHRYEGYATKISWTDSKEKHTGGLSRPTRFFLTITFRIGEPR